MSASTVAAMGAMFDTNRQLIPLLEEHLDDNDGEMLPHLVLADVIRWLVAHRSSEPETCASVLNWMEAEFIHGPEDVRGLIRVSGVQMIPDPGEPGAELRQLLGPALREIDPWRG